MAVEGPPSMPSHRTARQESWMPTGACRRAPDPVAGLTVGHAGHAGDGDVFRMSSPETATLSGSVSACCTREYSLRSSSESSWIKPNSWCPNVLSETNLVDSFRFVFAE